MTHQERLERAAKVMAKDVWGFNVTDWNRGDLSGGDQFNHMVRDFAENIVSAYLGDDELYVHDGELRHSDDGSTMTARECIVHAHEWGMFPLGKEEST